MTTVLISLVYLTVKCPAQCVYIGHNCLCLCKRNLLSDFFLLPNIATSISLKIQYWLGCSMHTTFC